MHTNMRKPLQRLLAIALSFIMLGLLPMTAFAESGALAAAAADAAVCTLNGMEYTSADAAISAAFSIGGTLKLLQDISFDYSVTLQSSKSLTVDLNSHTLTLGGLTVSNAATLTLSGEDTGARLNVNSESPGATAVKVLPNAKATVSGISSAYDAISLDTGASLHVSGNVQADRIGVKFDNSFAAKLVIDGNITVVNAEYGIYANNPNSSNSITINGDIRVTGRDGYSATGVYATDSLTVINGGIYVQRAVGSWDIIMGATPDYRSLGQGNYNESDGYFCYQYYDSGVFVKGYPLTVAASGGTINTGASGPYEGGRKINLAATPNTHHTFTGWVSSNGGTFVNSAAASTTFVMPAAATTVTANFTDNIAPARKNGVPATASANVAYGGAYTLNLSNIFTDADADALTYKVSVNGVEAIDADAAYSYTPASADTTVLTFTANDGYADSTDSYTVTVTVDKTTPTTADLTYQLAARTYNGLAQPFSVTGPAGLGVITVKYDGSATQPKDAKTYAVTVSIAAGTNYAATTVDIPLGDYSINKANLTVTGASAKTYDGTTDATGVILTFDGLQNGETLELGTDYTITDATFDSASVGGGKTITATAALNNTAKASNYTLANGSLMLTGQTIQKGTVADVTFGIDVVTNLAKDYTMSYQEFAEILADLTGKVLGTVSYSLTSVENTDGVLAALPSTGPMTFPTTMRVAGIAAAGKEATLIGTVTSANYNDFTVTAVIRTVDRIPVTISGLTMTGGIYNGSSYAYSGTPLFTSDLSGNPVSIPEFDVLYTSTDGGGYANSLPPQNAGTYQLTISVANGNLAYTGSKSYAFTIAKRPVVIRADDKSMTAGSSLPAFTYTVDGQLSGETAFIGTPTLACAADGKTAGSYPISLDLTGITYTGNYTAAIPGFVAGTLTVNSGGSDGGGSSGGPRTLTDSKSGITILGGGIKSLAKLTVTAVSVQSLPAKMREEIATGRMIAGYDITLPGGFRGELTISFPVGAAYEGQTVTILHYVNGQVETYTAVVANGRATITVSSLSPFAVLSTGVTVPDAVVTDPPKTGDAAAPWGFMMLGLAAVCAVAAAKKRRRV